MSCCRGLGLRHHRDVGGRHLHDGCVGALGHEPLQRRRDRLVLAAEQVPARDPCLPGRRARRCVERGAVPRSLRRGHDVGRGAVDVGGEGRVERLEVEVEVRGLAPVRAGERHGPDRRPHEAALEPLEELRDALALVGHPPVEVHERLDLVVAGRGGRDDRAAVGVADEHERTGQGPQVVGQVRRVLSESAKRVGEPDRAEASLLEGADLRREAGGVGPGAVDKDDRRPGVAGLRGHVNSSPASGM